MLISHNDVKQKRRLQFVGGATYSLSLPKKWVDELQIKTGDNVTIVKNSNKSLTIFPDVDEKDIISSTIGIATISQNDSNESIRRKIIAMYLAGYYTIEIRAKGFKIQLNHARIIKDLARLTLIGTEIIESNSESIKLQILTRLPDLSFDIALRRMYLMASNMHQEAIEAFSNVDKISSESIVNMDDEVDRFGLYMLRNLNLALKDAKAMLEIGLKEPSACLGYRTVIRSIERIADHAALIAKRTKFLEPPINKNLLDEVSKLSKDSLLVFENSISALSKKDYQLAEKVVTQTEKVVEKEKILMDDMKESLKNSTVIKFVLENIRRTAEYSSDIAEVVIDENIQSVITEK